MFHSELVWGLLLQYQSSIKENILQTCPRASLLEAITQLCSQSSTHCVTGIHTLQSSTQSSCSESVPLRLPAVVVNGIPDHSVHQESGNQPWSSSQCQPSQLKPPNVSIATSSPFAPPPFANCWTPHSFCICHLLMSLPLHTQPPLHTISSSSPLALFSFETATASVPTGHFLFT